MPDGNTYIFVAGWFVESESSVLSLYAETIYFLFLPLGTTVDTYGLDFPTSSVITGMRGAIFCCWFIESDSSVLFLSAQTRHINLMYPLGSTAAFTASIFPHTLGRSLRACAETRRASARRDDVHLV